MTCINCLAQMLKYFSSSRNRSYWKCPHCDHVEWVDG